MKKRILIIDDEKDLCELIKNVLKKEGFRVDCAYSLKDAEDKLKSHPEIILLDNNLPDGSGLDYLKNHPGLFIQCYIIIITSDSTELIQIRDFRKGDMAFLQKPFTMKSMKEIINQAA